MQTTAQGFKYVEPADAIVDFPAGDQTNWKLVEARTPRRVTSAQMSALTGLVDGQEIELEVDATLGIYWRLRYRPGSASAFKWEFVGGPPLVVQADAVANFSCPTSTWVSPAGEVFIDLLRAGDWVFEFGASLFPSDVPCTAWVGLSPGAGIEPTVDGARAIGGYHPVASGRVNYERVQFEAGLPAAAHCLLRYRQTAATQPMNRFGAFISALPRRLS